MFLVFSTTYPSASLQAGPVAPASIATLKAAGLDAGPEGPPTALWHETLGAATVSIQDSAGAEWLAQLGFAGAGQINFVIPEGVAIGEAVAVAIGRD